MFKRRIPRLSAHRNASLSKKAATRGATMFESSLVDSSPFAQPRNRWPAMLSFAIQAVIVTALIAIPLLHPEILPLTVPKLQVVAPEYHPAPPPPIMQPVRVHIVTVSDTPAAPTQATSLPRQAFRSDAQTVDAPALSVGLNIGDTGPNPLSALLGNSPTGSRVSVSGPPASASPTAPLRITTGVLAGMLLEPIRPQYPAIARISHTEGTVVVEAIISRTGHIESAHVVSGPAMLQASALQAVRDARYRPFLLNNEPTEVSTTISINFRLGGG